MSGLDKIISDARRLVSRLRERDDAADHLLASARTLYNKVDAMKQYEEDVTALNELAQHRPRARLVLDIARESRQLRELRAENGELKACLEEHQSALELIMSKYRQHIGGLMSHTRPQNLPERGSMPQLAGLDKEMGFLVAGGAPLGVYPTGAGGGFMNGHAEEEEEELVEQSRIEKICEMAAVMKRAIATDDKLADEERQRITRLETENQGLRALLQINRSYGVSLDLSSQANQGEGEEEGRRGDRTPTPTNELEEMEEDASEVANHVGLGDHTLSSSEA